MNISWHRIGHVNSSVICEQKYQSTVIIGLAVAGMPIGSPGMEMEGTAPQPFEVIAFDKSGKTEVFASYPK